MAAFSYHLSKGAGWFRVFGYGLSWKSANRHELTFSERKHLVPYIILFGYSIRPLGKGAQ